METKLDGIGDRAVTSMKSLAKDVLTQGYHTAGVLWQQGMQELANAMYVGSPIPIPQTLTVSQLQRSDLMHSYEQQLSAAHDRAVEHPEPDREIQR
jgi:hypothetical protein